MTCLNTLIVSHPHQLNGLMIRRVCIILYFKNFSFRNRETINNVASSFALSAILSAESDRNNKNLQHFNRDKNSDF